MASNSLEKILPLLKFDKLDDKQALLIKPAEVVSATVAYRKKWRDRLDRLKKEADAESRKGALSYHNTKT